MSNALLFHHNTNNTGYLHETQHGWEEMDEDGRHFVDAVEHKRVAIDGHRPEQWAVWQCEHNGK